MEPRTALVLALVAGGLAVGLVVADLNFTLTARLETKESGGGWRLVQRVPQSEEYPRYVSGLEECAGRELRLVVENDKPLPDEVRIIIFVTNGTGRQTTVLDDSWNLQEFEDRAYEFTVPEEALVGAQDGSSSPQKPGQDGRANVSVTVGDLNLWSCVWETG